QEEQRKAVDRAGQAFLVTGLDLDARRRRCAGEQEKAWKEDKATLHAIESSRIAGMFTGFGTQRSGFGGKGSTGIGLGVGIWAPSSVRQSARRFRSSAALSGCAAATSRFSPGSATRS